MKTYKLNGLEYYTCAFSKADACHTFINNKMLVTPADIIETDIQSNRDSIGKVFKSLDEYITFTL